MSIGKITPCLWFNDQAEEAANNYISIFPNSKITHIQRHNSGGTEKVMVVAFELNNQAFVGLNGGPAFKFNEAVSFQIECVDQEEVDHYWGKLGEGGDEKKQNCGWLGDRYGVSWQVIPKCLQEMLGDGDGEKVKRVVGAMMMMKKMDIGELRKAFDGESE
jgi:predicted 3-demethylubiquinone-9 3-methyltransferase (glyoxalase superfamily)